MLSDFCYWRKKTITILPILHNYGNIGPIVSTNQYYRTFLIRILTKIQKNNLVLRHVDMFLSRFCKFNHHFENHFVGFSRKFTGTENSRPSTVTGKRFQHAQKPTSETKKAYLNINKSNCFCLFPTFIHIQDNQQSAAAS